MLAHAKHKFCKGVAAIFFHIGCLLLMIPVVCLMVVNNTEPCDEACQRSLISGDDGG